MFLLDALRCILCCGQDEQEQDIYSYRLNRDYSSLHSPILRSRSSPQNHSYRDESRPFLPSSNPIVDSRGNSKLPDVNISHGDGNRAIYSNFYSPTFSSSVSDSSIPASLSSKPCFALVSSTNSNISEAGSSIGPEKFQLKKNSARCSPENPYTASQLSKCPSSHFCLSTAPAPLSQKPSFAPGSSTNNNGSATELSTDAERLKIMESPAMVSQLSKAPSPSISSSAAPPPSSKKPPLASVSSTINQISAVWIPICPEKLQISPERPDVATMFSQCDSLYNSSSAKDSVSPVTQSKASSSKRFSLATVSSSKNSSISDAPFRVWKVKSPMLPESTTKLPAKPCSSSLSHPSSRKKNRQTSMEASRESVLNLPALSVSPDSSSSSTSPPSSLLESGKTIRRVLPKFEIPKYLEEMIRNDIVPPILLFPLSPSTYGDFFATLLYAEDFYIEKWNDYLLEGITLELRSRISSTNSQCQRDFVAFEIDSIPERRPYILSRDFVFLKPLNEIAGIFKGRVFRVVKSTILLVEFGDNFHSQHSPSKRYNVSFSFNRVCLKRAHHAISVASDPSFHSILFPDQSVSSYPKTVHLLKNVNLVEDHAMRILNHKGPIPFLVKGQLVKERRYDENLSFTGQIIQVALLNLYRTNPGFRILVCTPTNYTSDLLLRSLRVEMPVSSLFRANAAYRDYDLVPEDIIPASLYEEEEECFACPPLAELLNYNIITCTFMSSFRLFAAGIDSGHFTHIFLVDASLAIEPEAIVPLAHLAGRNTIIVVSGCAHKSPSWVRANIARRHGLKKSYFSRLLEMEPYASNDSMFIAQLA